MKNRLGLILNAHLPYVRHPEYPRFLEEDWLFEAISESYFPLLRMLKKLRDEGVPYSFTLSLSPTLCNMLSDPVLLGRYTNYLNLQHELSEKELERCAKEQPESLPMAQAYHERIELNIRDHFETYQCNVLEGFADLEHSGHLELITTAATHAYLPLYSEYPAAIKAQIALAVQSHVNHFKKRPNGFWLPECGYFPGLEEFLQREEISYFQTASQALLLSSTPVERGNYAAVQCPNGIYAFPRDYHLSNLVWSNSAGYPTDVDYREFYRDIGYDLPLSYIGEYIHDPEVRVFTGFKYHAITGNTDQKRLYSIDRAQAKVARHADNFLYNLRRKGSMLRESLDRDPYFTITFNAELFGHWWYEGVDWLEAVIRRVSTFNDVVMQTPGQYIGEDESVQVMQPGLSSWADGGYANAWTSGENVWIYRHLYKALERMSELANRFPGQTALKERFLNQSAREVLLAMASDWPYMINNGSSIEYAQKRLNDHLVNFNLVYENMCKNAVSTEWLVKAEKRNMVFPDIDYNIFATEETLENS